MMVPRVAFLIFCCFLILPLPAKVQAARDADSGYFPADYHEVHTDPVVGEPIQKYIKDGQKGAQQNFGNQAVHDDKVFATLSMHRLEYHWLDEGDEALVWDAEAWVGNNYNKIYLKSEGEALMDPEHEIEEFTLELLYSRNIHRFWDVQLGVRHDFDPSPERTFLAFGIQGLAPQWIEFDATTYVSEDGDASITMEMEYEMLITQRLVLLPRLEAGASLHDVPKYEQWKGITDIELGLRLMYHIQRKFAPYIGVNWHKMVGKSANRIEAMGGDTDTTAVTAGVHFWF